MQVQDLTDDDIGRIFWVKCTLDGSWQRICFEGLTRKPAESLSQGPAALAAVNGGQSYWMILKATPAPGLMRFRTPAGEVLTGLLVRATADVVPVTIDWAVTADGRIVELGERAA